jgi:hypothetical protein
MPWNRAYTQSNATRLLRTKGRRHGAHDRVTGRTRIRRRAALATCAGCSSSGRGATERRCWRLQPRGGRKRCPLGGSVHGSALVAVCSGSAAAGPRWWRISLVARPSAAGARGSTSGPGRSRSAAARVAWGPAPNLRHCGVFDGGRHERHRRSSARRRTLSAGDRGLPWRPGLTSAGSLAGNSLEVVPHDLATRPGPQGAVHGGDGDAVDAVADRPGGSVSLRHGVLLCFVGAR